MKWIVVAVLLATCVARRHPGLRKYEPKHIRSMNAELEKRFAKPSPRSPDGFPMPNQAQWDWLQEDISFMISYNMVTSIEEQVLWDQYWYRANRASVFNPIELDVENWFAAMRLVLGNDSIVTQAVLTTKHVGGFLLWPSNTTLPGGQRYNYSVAFSSWGNGQRDVVGEYVDKAAKWNIIPGFYYSFDCNTFLNYQWYGYIHPLNETQQGQIGVTEAQLHEIQLGHAAELWGTYGKRAKNGILGELWFDGGLPPNQTFLSELAKVQAALQPGSVTFGGYPAMINQVRGIASEYANASWNNWDTGPNNNGDPNSPYFIPPECDYTLLHYDTWFYDPNVEVRPLATLVEAYHTSVGRNCKWLLNLSPNALGYIPHDHMDAYAKLGMWLQSCYYGVAPLAATSVTNTNTLSLDVFGSFDRVVIKENIQFGQKIRTWTLSYVGLGSDAPATVIQYGESIGNKIIVRFPMVNQGTIKFTWDNPSTTVWLEARLCDDPK
jgi:alpha-L-fucosidase